MTSNSAILFGRASAFQDFERAILGAVVERLPQSDADILRSQLERLNSSYEEYDEVSKRLMVYYYWRTFFRRSRNDFPKRWEGDSEKILARIEATYGQRFKYCGEVVVVLGRLFAIELSSNAEELRPLGPDFVFSRVEVFPNGGIVRQGS